MNTLDVRVCAIRSLTPVIRELTLEPVDAALPAFSAGSHIQLWMNDGTRTIRNAYSLLGDPMDRRTWRIAVRRQERSRGGSAFVHERIHAGMTLRVTAPANLFALNATCRTHILVAGGIGITPFLAHIAELERSGADYELHYACRPGLTDAYLADLSARLGTRLHSYDGSERVFDARRVLAGRPLGAHVYVCGPERMLADVRNTARALGWPDSRVHWEAFVAAAPGAPFTAQLGRSARSIDVASDQSLLEALESAGLHVPNLCRGGVCGQCATRYLDGEVEHRDAYLTATERATHLMPCVSRACGRTLTLDL